MNGQKLKNGIMVVFIANVINVFFSLATNFLLPKYLSDDSYAAIKTFQLYVSYVGFLHLGYVDGTYLKYGGKVFAKHVDADFSLNLSTMKVFQIVLTMVLLIIDFCVKDWLIVLFTISVLPMNVGNYFKFLYQATGEFKLYGRIMNFSTIATFTINIILLFIFRTDSYLFYLILYVLLYYIIWFVLEIQFRSNHIVDKSTIFSWQELTKNIKEGFLLTLGNLSSIILTSMDRWFVKVLMDTVAFARYSFAVSIENFLNIAITPITTTLYNFFCTEKNSEKHKNVLQVVIIFATILPACAFPVKFILENFLTEYIDASDTVFYLFAAQILNTIVRSVFVNLYKVQRKQRCYFAKLVIILIVGFISNTICFYFWRTKEAFAMATLLSAILWFAISVNDFIYLQIPINNYLYIVIEIVAFLFCGLIFDSCKGLIIYIVFTIFMAYILMRSTLQLVFNAGRQVVYKNRN